MAKRRRIPAGYGISAAAIALLLAATPAFAQSKDKAAKGSVAAPADSGLQARVQSLEEQLVDMQVVVGTLETLAKNPGSAQAPFPASTAGGDGDAARIEGLETQVRALTAQVQQLSDQVRSLGGTPRRSDIPASSDTALADQGAYPQAQAQPVAAPSPGFGSTTTVAAGDDAIGGLINGGGAHAPQPVPVAASQQGAAPVPASVATAALAPASETSNDPKQLYETAYGYLLQRDYGAAETAFDDFLKKFPNDSLSGNAQYWLGETHFVRGQYKAAASAFLKGYQTYAQSAKAPDSLLKLAMSLDRLGQKDAACSSFAELASKFPTAPQSVKARAQSERQRVGCQ
ncbi:MAG TPA: tol-pal system protein YbgF [Hyphomicrobium sp.]|jgi:tol-pal system protein YbgF|nr:tol-pal system protein YbgF [Hyphomicrobium sp.]